MALHFVAFTLCVFSLVLLLLANIGSTFRSDILNKLYFVQLSKSSSIRYGLYSSCLYTQNDLKYCTPNSFVYTFDIQQLAIACDIPSNSTLIAEYAHVISSSVFSSLLKYIVLIMPCTVLAFLSFCFTLILRKGRKSSAIPLLGTFVSLLSFFSGAAGLALLIVTFWKGLAVLENRVEGLTHQWGPSVYLVGVGIGCILGAFICFVLSAFGQRTKNEASDLTNYNHLANTNELSKHESYTDHSPTQARYPSYHRQPEAQYPHSPYQQNDITYQQNDTTYHHNTYTPQVYDQIYDNYTSPQAYHHPQQHNQYYDSNKPHYV